MTNHIETDFNFTGLTPERSLGLEPAPNVPEPQKHLSHDQLSITSALCMIVVYMSEQVENRGLC